MKNQYDEIQLSLGFLSAAKEGYRQLRETTVNIYTTRHTAPQQTEENHNKQVDVYAFDTIFYELLSGNRFALHMHRIVILGKSHCLHQFQTFL